MTGRTMISYGLALGAGLTSIVVWLFQLNTEGNTTVRYEFIILSAAFLLAKKI